MNEAASSPIPSSSRKHRLYLGWGVSLLLGVAALLCLAMLLKAAGRLGLEETGIVLFPLAVGALAVFAIWPGVALALWVFASGLVPFPLIGGELFLYDLFTLVLAGLWLLQLLRTGRMEISGPDWAVLAVAVAALLSIVMNLDRTDEVADRFFRLRHFHLEFPGKTNLSAALLWMVYLAAYFFASQLCNTPRKIFWTLIAALAMALANSLYALYFWAIDPLGFSRMNRTIGLLQDIQDQGNISAIFLLGAVVALVTGLTRGWKRWTLLGCAAILTLNLVFNFTRATYLETAFCFGLLFFSMRSLKALAIPVVLAALVAAVIFMVQVDKNDLVMFTDMGSKKARGISLRMVSWTDAVRISREHGNFWGIGLGNYAVYSEAVIFTAAARRTRLSSAHGMYLQILAEQGVPGLLVWMGFFAFLLVYFYRSFRRSQIPSRRALNLWCFLLTAMFTLDGLLIMSILPPGHSHEALTAGYYVWVVWGLGVAWNRLTPERAPHEAGAPGAPA